MNGHDREAGPALAGQAPRKAAASCDRASVRGARPRPPPSRRASRVATALVRCAVVAMSGVATALADDGRDTCEVIARAVALGDAQARASVGATVLEGRHPAGYRAMQSFVVGDRQFLVLDGRGYGPGEVEREGTTRGEANGMVLLAPDRERPCERRGQASLDGRVATVYEYVGSAGPAGRFASRIELWIDDASGLPARALIDAPELVYSRVLSRPTKPPQVTLKPTGRRYREVRDFRYGDAVILPKELD